MTEQHECRCRLAEGLRSTHCPLHGTCNCCHGATCPTHDEPEHFVPMTLDQLLEAAREHVITPEELEAQRRSFAFGNANIDNPNVTREMVDRAAERLKQEADGEK